MQLTLSQPGSNTHEEHSSRTFKIKWQRWPGNLSNFAEKWLINSKPEPNHNTVSPDRT